MLRFSSGRERATAWIAVAVAISVLAGAATGAGGATTGSTTLGADVASATALGMGGCAPNVFGRTSFGAVAAESSNVTTSDCTITFGSSNDSASLRVAQVDGTGMAMSAVPDRLQTSFGTGGISTLASGVGGMASNGAKTSILLPDGKLVGAGSGYLAGEVQSIVYRRNADGTLDTTFNAPNGYVAFNAAPARGEALYGIDLQPDGKLVAVGQVDTGGTDRNGHVVRVNANGTLDTAFGGGGTGWRVVDLGGTGSGERYADVSVEAGGTIVAVGNDDLAGIDDRWVLDRFTAAGLPDPATGGGTGRVVINPSANQDRAQTITPHPAGGFLVGGQSQPSSFVGHVIRVGATLNPLTTWGASGHRQVDIVSYYEDVREIEVLADGSALLAIDQAGGFANHAIVAKLTPGGALDTAGFAAPNGFAELPSTADYDHTQAIEVSPTGVIYVLYDVDAARLGVGRLLATGALDTAFGNGGTRLITGVHNPGIRSMHLVGGSIVIATANSAVPNDSMVRLGGLEVDDYLDAGGGSDRDWSSGSSTSFFGVCLRDLTDATAVWAVDPNVDCTIDDDDPWRAIPKLTSDPDALVGQTADPGDTGTAQLRFAFRPSRTLPSGAYEAPLAIEVVAPA